MTVRTNRPKRQLAVENDPPNTSSKRQVTSADATDFFFPAKQNLQQNCSWKNSQQALSSPARITGCAAAEASSTPKAALRLSRVEKDERLKLHVPKNCQGHDCPEAQNSSKPECWVQGMCREQLHHGLPSHNVPGSSTTRSECQTTPISAKKSNQLPVQTRK